jgi:hypothetical protein
MWNKLVWHCENPPAGASGIGVLAEQGEGAFVLAGGVHLEVDVVFLQEAVEVRQLADHADRTDDGEGAAMMRSATQAIM